MRPNPRPQEMYRHFKGNIYQIRCLAKHSETGEMMVVYQAMYDTFQIYVRPLAMFMEEVDVEKYPDARQQYRFELLQDSELVSGSQATEETISRLQAVEETISGLQAVEEPVKESNEGSGGTENAEEMQQLNIDPLVMEFLEADTYEQRLNILAALRSRITDEMINTMAIAIDVEVKPGDITERYEELKYCLATRERFECRRLR